MHVTDLALNRTLGMQLAQSGDGQLLELPESPLLLNHVGTIHASAQYALAEACSGEFLIRQLGELQSEVFAVLRTSEVKYRKPAHGLLHASARFAQNQPSGTGEGSVIEALGERGRALVSVLVTVSDMHEVVTMTGQFDWLLQRQTSVD